MQQLPRKKLKFSNLHKNLEKFQAVAACHMDDMSTKIKDQVGGSMGSYQVDGGSSC
jgi:DNA-binding ferritin-like protein